MALPSQGFAAAQHRLSILLRLGHDALYEKCREQAEREASPTAAIIDSQSVRSAEKGGASIDPHGFDAGKKIKGKKRHVLVDTQGLLMQAIVHSADVQDRDGGVLLLATLFGRFPYLEKLFADSAYQGPIFADALAKMLSRVKIEIVKRSDQAKGFVTLPKRWIVERSIAWLNRCRRLAKDWENLNVSRIPSFLIDLKLPGLASQPVAGSRISRAGAHAQVDRAGGIGS